MHLYEFETFYTLCINSRAGGYIPAGVLEPTTVF